MSIDPTTVTRSRNTMLRQLAVQAATHPRIEAAVMGAIRAELPGVIEGLLRDSWGGDTLRMYVPKNGSRDDKDARDQRIVAMASPPSSATPHAIAAREGISVRRVQQILSQAQRRKIGP